MACPLLLEQILMRLNLPKAKKRKRVATHRRERESLRDIATEGFSEIEINTRPTRESSGR
jgi:hypothetical protein